MPRGPKGEKRPADAIGAAVKVMKIATAAIAENIDPEPLAAAATRPCPHCAEPIQPTAKVCRHCHRDVAPEVWFITKPRSA